MFAPDGLVARKEGSTWTYYTFDQQGNVAQRLNSSEVVQTSRVFDAWGEGAETTQPKSLDCWNYNVQWGYYYDRETSLYYCQNRMYDASTGRWINRDPIGYAGGVNLYGYCAGGPVGWADTTGTSKGKIIVDILGKAEYWVYDSMKNAKKAAKNRGAGNKIDTHGGHQGGPRHHHSEGDPRNIHYTSANEADKATDPAWDDWRKKGRWAPGMVPLLGKNDCYEASGGEQETSSGGGFGLGDLLSGAADWAAPGILGPLGFAKDFGKDILPAIVDPFVENSRRKREEALNWWLEG